MHTELRNWLNDNEDSTLDVKPEPPKRRTYSTTKPKSSTVNPELQAWLSGRTSEAPQGPSVQAPMSESEAMGAVERAKLKRDVLTNLSKANAYSSSVIKGVEGLPSVADPSAIKKLAAPPWYKQVLPWLGRTAAETAKKDIATVGQAIDTLDRYTLRPVRSLVYGQAEYLARSLKDPTYAKTHNPFTETLNKIKRGFTGEDAAMGADTLREVLPEAITKPKLLPLLGAGMALGGGSDAGLAGVMYPDLAKAKAEERAALMDMGNESLQGKGYGPDVADVLGFAADVALGEGQSKAGLVPLTVGRRITKLGAPTQVVTNEAREAANLANASRLLKRQGVVPGRPADLEELRKALSPDVMAKYTNRAADLAYQEATNPLPGLRKFRPTNTAQRQLDEIMQRAKRAPIDTEASITNTRQAREYLRGVFGATPEEITALSDAEAMRLATEAQQAKTLPTALERVQREAKATGANLDDLFKQASESPMDRMRRLSERAGLARAAGVAEAPRGIKNPFVQPETTTLRLPETTTRGLEVFGNELISPAQAKQGLGALSKLSGLDRLGETAVGKKLEGVGELLGQAFNRRHVPKGAPESVAEIPAILDRQADISHQVERKIRERLTSVMSETRLSKAEDQLAYHIRDLGLPFTVEGAEEAVRKAALDSDVLKSLTPERMKSIAKYDAAFQHEYNNVLAPLQKEAGVNLRQRENYVTHAIRLNQEAARRIEMSYPTMTRQLQHQLSGVHGFLNQRQIPTLAQVKAINRAAVEAGLPAPFEILTESYLDAFGKYTQKALSAVANRKALKDLSEKYPELVRFSEKPPGNGWLNVNEIPGAQEALDGQMYAWLHPEAKQKLARELVRLKDNPGAGQVFGTLMRGLDSLSNVYRASMTAFNVPWFQIRNVKDNYFKRWLFDALGNDEVAGQIMRGGNELVTVSKPLQLRDFRLINGEWKYEPGHVQTIKEATATQWKELFGNLGLIETGQFGRHGDIATSLKSELKRGPLLKALRAPQDLGRVTEDTSKIGAALSKASEIGDVGAGVQEANRMLFRYSDLTPFERDILRPLSGFYTFRRKNIPLMAKAILEKPDKFAKLNLLREALRDKRVDESSLPEYQRNELTVPIRLPNDETFVYSPGFSVGDAFRALPHRWPDNVAETVNPVISGLTRLGMGQDRWGNKLDRMPPKDPPAWLPDGIAMRISGAITVERDGKTTVKIPASWREALDMAMMGAPLKVSALFEGDGSDEDKARRLQKFIVGSFGSVYSQGALEERQLRAARENIQRIREGIEEATGRNAPLKRLDSLSGSKTRPPIDVEKLKSLGK